MEAVYLAIAELDEYYDLTPIEQIRQLITEDATAQMCLKSRQFQNSTYKDPRRYGDQGERPGGRQVDTQQRTDLEFMIP